MGYTVTFCYTKSVLTQILMNTILVKRLYIVQFTYNNTINIILPVIDDANATKMEYNMEL